jgi:NAD(P)-dependent dehydrogenase (short-subunit alcohol dehydrogenase family)
MSAFTNKVAAITGGNSGSGLATAREFSRRGAKVVLRGRDERTLAAAATSLRGEALAVRADVSRLVLVAFDLDPAWLTVPPLDGLEPPHLRAALAAVDAELTAGGVGGREPPSRWPTSWPSP